MAAVKGPFGLAVTDYEAAWCCHGGWSSYCKDQEG